MTINRETMTVTRDDITPTEQARADDLFESWRPWLESEAGHLAMLGAI